VELAALIAVPLLMRYRAALTGERLGKTIWFAGCLLIAVSLLIQLASLAFWLPLEIYQMETLGHPTFVIALRFKNIAAFALGKMDAWGLNTEAMPQDPWDYVHITTWNFLAVCAAARRGSAPLGSGYRLRRMVRRACSAGERCWSGCGTACERLCEDA